MLISARRLFFRVMGRPHRSVPPRFIERILRPKEDPQLRSWMERHSVTDEALLKASWFVFRTSSVITSAMVGVLSFAGLPLLPFGLLVIVLAPLIAASLFANVPKNLQAEEERRMVCDAPAMIASMTMSLHLQPSLERALHFAASQGSGPLQARLAESGWKVWTKAKQDVEIAILDLSGELSELSGNLRQALHLLVAATYEPSAEGGRRLLDKANDLVIEGLKETVDRYAASLTIPTMVLFSMGVLLPVMMFSSVPLLALTGGLASSSTGTSVPMDPSSLLLPSVLVLGVVPLASFAYASRVIARNPLHHPTDIDLRLRGREAMLLVVWTGGVLAVHFGGISSTVPQAMVLALALPPSAYAAIVSYQAHRAKKERPAKEKDFLTALYRIGNRMSGGASLDTIIREMSAPGFRSSFKEFARRILYASSMTHAPVGRLIAQDARLRSEMPLVWGAMASVAECSEKDPREAGRMAVNLAQNLSAIRASQLKAEENLRGVVDMMRSTGTFLAPIVLGITCALFSLIEKFGGQNELTGAMIMITGAFVIELSFIVSYFMVKLSSEGDWSEVLYQFGTKTPIAVGLFSAVSLFAHEYLIRLL